MILFLLLLLPISIHSFLFGSSSSCCSCPPPCPPQPVCQPIMSCNPCRTCKRSKREVLSNATFVAEDGESDRVLSKREISEKCNSEELREIIEKKIDRITAIAKQRIQEEAEATMDGRFNVICARGDFSYVTNTELYCQHTVGDVTCFLFKQLSDVVRRRLA